MTIGFYINNSQFLQVDCRNVIDGNPGIGGTWHLFLVAASQLALRDNGLDIVLYVQKNTGLLPEGPTIVEAKDNIEALELADKSGVDYMILNLFRFPWTSYDFSCLISKMRIIVWCHNFATNRELVSLARNERVVNIINVSREQMDLYLDHGAYCKMDYIYDCVPFIPEDIEVAKTTSFGERKHIVTYMGSLVTQKRFHVLASIWPDILKEVPDAELYVIGNGRVHDNNVQLGKYGIAAADYEEMFMPYLTDSNGSVLNCVHFMGNMGTEKNKVLQKTKVGVPNPTGFTETFCLCAVEMQSMGAVVTAMKSPGYFDTFVNGVLVDNKKSLKNAIIKLLLADGGYEDCNDKLERLFSVDSSMRKWESILSTRQFKNPDIQVELKNKSYRLKWLKELIRKGKVKHLLPKGLLSLEVLLALQEKVIMKLRGY